MRRISDFLSQITADVNFPIILFFPEFNRENRKSLFLYKGAFSLENAERQQKHNQEGKVSLVNICFHSPATCKVAFFERATPSSFLASHQ